MEDNERETIVMCRGSTGDWGAKEEPWGNSRSEEEAFEDLLIEQGGGGPGVRGGKGGKKDEGGGRGGEV